jgi:hypothetical protein
VNLGQGVIYSCWWPYSPRRMACTGCLIECCKNDVPLLMICTRGL